MLLPVFVNLIENDRAAQGLCNLLTLSLIGLLEVNPEIEDMTSVADRNIDGSVVRDGAVLLVNLLDDRIGLLYHGLHTAVVDLLHVPVKLVGHILRLGVGIELGVETEVDRESGDHILLEILILHAFRLLGNDHRRVLHHVLDIDFYALSGKGVAATGIDGLSLVIHHVVVLQGAFAPAEMVLLDLLLGRFNGVGEHL